MAFNGISGFLLIVSSSIVARRAEGHLCLNHNCQILETAAVSENISISQYYMIDLIDNGIPLISLSLY